MHNFSITEDISILSIHRQPYFIIWRKLKCLMSLMRINSWHDINQIKLVDMIFISLVRRQYLQIFPTDFIYRPSNFSPWSYLPTHRCTCANDNVFRAMPFMASMAFASLLSWAKLWCFLGWLLDDRWMRCALFLNDLGFKCWWILRLCLTLILTCYCLINTLSLIAVSQMF